MFTPAERKEVRLESTAPSHRESSDVPVPFQAGTYPWVRREPHSMVCGNTASHCARHKQRKGDCSGPMGASPIPHGPSPPEQAARCVCLPAWTGGTGRGQGWTGIPELPLWPVGKGKSMLGSSAACCPLFPRKRYEVHWQNSGSPNLGW